MVALLDPEVRTPVKDLLPLFLLLLLVPSPCTAVGNGTVRITVKDGKGHPIEGASIRLIIKDTWQKHDRSTDVDGLATFHALPSKEFRITVDRSGFLVHTDARDCLRVPPSGTLEMSVVLRSTEMKGQSAKENLSLPCPSTTPSSEVSTQLSSREYRRPVHR